MIVMKNMLHKIVITVTFLFFTFTEILFSQGHQIVDIDGNYYNIITIGAQIWMAENLKTTRYNDGVGISYPGNNNTEWLSNTTGAYAWYNNNEVVYKSTYGALYNWYTVDAASNENRNVCPTGWRVPTSDEFLDIQNLYGGWEQAGGPMKTTGTIEGENGLWYSPNTGGTNTSGFTGLPSGYRHPTDAEFYELGRRGDWWYTTGFRSVVYNNTNLYNENVVDANQEHRSYGLGIRCIHGGGILFTTPSLVTLNITSITPTSARSGGGKISKGGSTITSKGVCWGITRNPTIGGLHTDEGAGDELFYSDLSGLTPNTTYYVRAYATNSVGTAYGDEKTFTTCPEISATITGPEDVCLGSESVFITFTAENGTPPYTFTYNVNKGSSQTISTSVGNSVNVAVPTNEDTEFYYSLENVRDASAGVCVQYFSEVYLSVTVNPLPVLTASITNVTCTGCLDGAIDLTASGGTPEYVYNWTGSDEFTSNSEDLSAIGDGIYNVIVTDANGCTESVSGEVMNPLKVTNTDDEGFGSLRYAIDYANGHMGTDKIIFKIPTDEDFVTIMPLTPLPNITESVEIDGYSQPGATRATMTSHANLLIELDGSLIPSENEWQMGLSLWGGSSTISGLMINNFGDAGIHIEGRLDQPNVPPCIDNIIEGNYIGVDQDGTLKGNNGGIRIWSSTGNIIGGDNPGNRNIISGGPVSIWGEGTFGIFILLPESANNIVKGNYIGIGPDGETGLNGSEVGVRINEGAHDNIIGPGNVISGNTLAGIQMEPLDERNSQNNRIIGNLIGTDKDGTNAVPNRDGIRIFGAINNIIGGDTPEERNIISGNTDIGIEIYPSENFSGSGNIITGNYIGLNSKGDSPIGNGSEGIRINSGNNQVGGINSGEGNVISGNNIGVNIAGNNADKNVIMGNYVGTNASGAEAIPNVNGVWIFEGNDNIIGGITTGARNIISGNSMNGIWINGSEASEASGNKIQGNYIGLAADGSSPLGNKEFGIKIREASGNTIGGPEQGSRNVISANGTEGMNRFGIHIEYDDSGVGNIVQGNFVGTDATGMIGIGNVSVGIMVLHASNNTIINNVVSGNRAGISIYEIEIPDMPYPSTNNKIQGNLIGIKMNGTETLGNEYHGVSIHRAKSNIIGGTKPGEANIIGGNLANGVNLADPGTSDNHVIGNYIGIDRTGKMPLSNGKGISIENEATGNFIGGSGSGTGNLIAFNTYTGISLGSDSTIVGGNIIKGHAHDGIFIDADYSIIGGSDTGMRNYINQNNNGIRTGFHADFNRIEGNYLGTDITGQIDQTDGQNGVTISGSDNTVINNLISGYEQHGIYIPKWDNTSDSPVPVRNLIEGNIIGLDADATDFIPNGHGITINTASKTRLIRNKIAGNNLHGVIVVNDFGATSTDNQISENSVYNNGLLGINLEYDDVTPNDSIYNEATGRYDYDYDTGANNLQNFPVIGSVSFSPGTVSITGTLNSMPGTDYTLEFFANKVADNMTHTDGKHYGEGETYLGTTTVTTGTDGNAPFLVTFPIKSGDGQVITATATDADGNTSEFSRAVGGLADQELGTGWPLHYRYNELGVENITNGSDITAVTNSFRTWSSIPTANISFVNDGPTTQKYANASDGINLVSFVDDKYPWAPGVLAYAAKTVRMDADGETAEIIDADIIVNPAFVNSLTGTLGVADEGGTSGYYDIQSVVTHEIGHLLGLLHTGVVDATMFFWLKDGTTDVRSLEPDDKAWASYKYPGTGFNSTYGTLSGNITYGYAPYPAVAGALVIAENETEMQFHGYSDAEGKFIVPVERSGSYTIFIQPLDGDVYGYPMKPGNISSYIYSNTIYTDYPDEYYSGTEGEGLETGDGIDRDSVPVSLADGLVSIRTNPDLTPPNVKSITPDSGSTVKVMPDIIIRFSEPVETSSLSDATCYLESGGKKYCGNFTEINGKSDVILFSPIEPLEYSNTYSLHLGEYVDENNKGITDLKGNSLVSTYPSYIITTVSDDILSPVVTDIIPADNAEGVFATEKIMLFFSEPMNRTSVESGFSLGCNGNPDIDGSFSWRNENTLMTFTPVQSLRENTLYTVSLSTGAADLSGNKMKAEFSSSFTTVPESAPEIVYLEPGRNLTSDVSVTTPVVVDFTEPVDPSTINQATFKLTNGTTQITGKYEFLNQNSRVIFRPDADLAFKKTYTVELKGGESGIRDVSQPALSMALDASSSFTTAAQVTIPDIFYIDPPSGVSGSIVKIVGEGFDPTAVNNIVTFVTIPALVKEATLSSLVVEVPRGALSGMVTITVKGSTTDPGFYFYVVPQSLDPCEEAVANVNTGTKSRDVAITPDGATAYVTNSGAGSVSIIDLDSYDNIGDIIAGIGTTPLKIDINPMGTRAYVTNFDSHTVSVIDLTNLNGTKNQVINVINVGINPYGVVVTPDGDRVYVSNFSSNNLSVIDADPNSGGFDHVVANVNTGTRNRDVTVTADAGLVLVAGDNGLTIVNSKPGDVNFNSVIANSSSGTKTRDVAVTGDAGFAVVSTEDGYLMVIDIFPGSDLFGTVLANVSSGSKVRDVSTSGDGLHVYVTTENGDVLVYQINPGGTTNPSGSYTGGVTLTLHETISNIANEGLVIDSKNERLLAVYSGSGTDYGKLIVIKICCGPITPEIEIGKLIMAIQSMINNGSVMKSHGNALIKKLDDALKNLSKEKTKTAINNLNEFIAKVYEYMAGGKMPIEQGNTLIDAANAIIAQLKGTKSELDDNYFADPEKSIDVDVVSESKLGVIYPNPFSESITISYEIGESTNDRVSISIYDMSGRLVGTLVNRKMEPGRYTTIWNRRDVKGGVASFGTYFVRLKTGNVEEVKEIMLIR
jgi:uncharacterized protein (TIGR02145 family)